MRKQPLRRAEIDADPNFLWNRLIDALAEAEPDQLDAAQKRLYLAFWYESEVQNGGHLQFFLNRPDGAGEETTAALLDLGLDKRADVLKRAVETWRRSQRKPPQSLEEYVARAFEGEFAALDDEFYSLSPSVIAALEASLDSNARAFFEIEPEG